MKKAILILLMTALLACPALASESVNENPLDDYEAEVTREATCAESGLITYTDPETGTGFTMEIPPTGEHDYESAETAPTCTEPGVITYTCTVCGDTYTEEIPPTGVHSYVYQYDAEQREDGTFSSCGTWRCEVCGDVVPADESAAIYYSELSEDGSELPEEETAPEDAIEEAPAEAPEQAPEEMPAETQEEAPAAQPSAGRSAGVWVAIEIAAAVFLVAEIVLLLLSLRRKQPFD